MKQYYIYPKSKNSEVIVDLFLFFNENISYDFIDDSCNNSSLNSLAETIKSSNIPVLLASNKYKDKLLWNLKEYGIENYQDGISLYASKIMEYLKQRTDAKKKKIGIVLSGIANEKHIANIDKLLLSLGYEIIYVCLSFKIYNQNSEKIASTVSIVANHEVLKMIDFFDCVISVTAISPSKNVFSINLTHAFCEPLSLPAFLGVDAGECGTSYANTTRYFCASSKRTSLALKSIFNTPSHPVVLDAGYPSLDADIEEYELLNEPESNEYVIFAMNKMPDISFMRELIDGIAKIGKILFFRPNPLYVTSPNVVTIMDTFNDNKYFKLDVSPKLDLKIVKKSATLITDYSSLGYTYPFVSLKPCVICGMKDGNAIDADKFVSFYDENIHYAAHTVLELLDCIKLICTDTLRNRDKIQKYRQDQVFNLGSSAEYIIKFIKDNLDK